MDIHAIEYMLAIADEGTISRAADKVCITQSALTQQLSKLEKELGMQLFQRTKHQMIPTFAGKTYIEGARQIKSIKDSTYKRLGDINDNRLGEISVGILSGRGALMVDVVIPRFLEEYPGYSVRITEARTKQMDALLLDGSISFAITADFDKHNPDIIWDCFSEEALTLGMSKDHPLAWLAGKGSDGIQKIDIKLLKDERFILGSRDTRIRDVEDRVFEEAGFKPHVVFELANTSTILLAIAKNLGIGFFPHYYARRTDLPLVFFTIGPQYMLGLGAAYKANTYLSKAEKHLIALSREYFTKIEPRLT